MTQFLQSTLKSPVKWGLAIAGVLCLGLGETFAQSPSPIGYTFQSVKQNGNWSDPTTWQRWQTGVTNAAVIMGKPGDPIPDNRADQITILKDFPVVVDTDITVDQLIIEPGATLTVANTKKVTVNDGAGTDILVQGTLVSLGGATDADVNFIQNAKSKISFANTGIYKHSPALKVGVIPTAEWDPASTIIFNYVSGSGHQYSTVLAGRGFNQSFGNVKWDTPNLTKPFFLNGQLQDIKGSFEVIATGSDRLVLSQSGTYTLSIGKDFIVSSTAKVGFTRENIIPSTNTPGTLELKLKRDLIIPTGATFANALIYGGTTPAMNVKFEGNSKLNVATALSNMNFVVMPAYNLTLDENFSLPNTSSLQVNGNLITGVKYILGAGNFSLNAGGSLSTGWQSGVNSINGPIRNTGARTLSTSAYYIFDRQNNFQNTGDLLPATVAGLTINNPLGVTLTNPVKVTNNLTLTKGLLNTGTTNQLVLTKTAAVSNGENTSFVNGPVSYEIASTGPTNNLVFPVGDEGLYRPLTLSLNQTNATAATYTVNLIDGAPASRAIPEEITHVSSLRHYNITSNSSGFTNAYITLTFAADDAVTDVAHLGIAKSDGQNWKYLGGSVNGNTVQTTTYFENSFSDIVLANAKNGNNPLPVELLSFKAVNATNAVNLTWETASEKNNDFFAIERSVDGRNFEVIGQVKGAGNSNTINAYAFADKNPANGVAYYRLKQTDFDGKYEYSKIVSVAFEGKVAQVVINAYPNPTASVLNVNVNGVAGKISLEITDVTGRTVKNLQINAGENTAVNVESLPKGLYQIRVVSSNATTVSKFMKQ